MKKRVFADKPNERSARFNGSVGPAKRPLQSASTEERVQVMLEHVTKDCNLDEIDPIQCIPLYLIRQKSVPAVRKLVAIFEGKASSDHSISGIASGLPSSVVVPLVNDLEPFIIDYFILEGYTEQDAKAMKAAHKDWYGIIDGCHFHAAIIELKRISPTKWSEFLWKVIVVKPDKSMAEYRQLARVQNEKNKAFYIHESTIFDLLKGLRLEYDELFRKALKNSRTGVRGAKINYKVVAERYDGGDHTKNTYIRQAVSVAVRISEKTIDAIGTVCNEDCAELILCDEKMNNSNLKTVDEVYSREDSRLFRNFICFGALRGAKAFMNAVLDGHEDAQVNTIFRLRHWSEHNRFKPAQASLVTEQFNLSLLALKEEEKFLSLINEERWPSNMENTNENLLRSTIFDNEIRLNSGNDKDVLPSIWRSFKRLYPTKGKIIEESLERQVDHTEHDEEDTPPSPPDDQTNFNDENDEEKRHEEELRRKKEKIINECNGKRSAADDHLKEIGISSYQMSFMDYTKEVCNTSSPKVDLVVSSIPKETTDDELKELPIFCKNVLKQGSYGFFILSEKQFTFLNQAFEDTDFKVMEHSFKILYDTTTIQRRSTGDFPQRHGDLALMTKSQGMHPEGFHPVFDDHVKFSSMLNIKCCQNKLRKPKQIASLCTSEKSIDLFNHIIKMLTPTGGSVLDPIAGPMTASISCLETGRSCISIESNADYFKFAMGRTRIYATPQATMEHLSMFVEPIDIDNIDLETTCQKNIDSPLSINGRASKRRRKCVTEVGNLEELEQLAIINQIEDRAALPPKQIEPKDLVRDQTTEDNPESSQNLHERSNIPQNTKTQVETSFNQREEESVSALLQMGADTSK